MLSVLVATVSGFTITATDIGGTYIQWNWTAGETTEMLVDGNLMCGYETTDPGFLYTNLEPDSLHNIVVYTATDMGALSTRTLNCTASPSSPGCAGGNATGDFYSVEDTPLPPFISLFGTIIAAVLFFVWRVRE